MNKKEEVTGENALRLGWSYEPLTVLWDFKDVADQGAVAIKSLGPC